jgi:hypothetical protein
LHLGRCLVVADFAAMPCLPKSNAAGDKEYRQLQRLLVTGRRKGAAWWQR